MCGGVVQRTLCDGGGEVYFIEPAAVQLLDELRQSMCRLSLAISARNHLRHYHYDNLCPQLIAASTCINTDIHTYMMCYS